MVPDTGLSAVPLPRPSLSVPVPRLRVRFCVLLPFLLFLFPLLCSSTVWDESPPPMPRRSFHSAIIATLDSQHLFAKTIISTPAGIIFPILDPTPFTGEATLESAAATVTGKNTTSLIIAMGGIDQQNHDSSAIYLTTWPFAVSRSGQQRWIRAPLVGTQPAARNSFGFVAQQDTKSELVGRAFVFGGANSEYFFASLWVLDLETTQWHPLGPSLMRDSSDPNGYSCAAKETYLHDPAIRLPDTTPTSGDVDSCAHARIGLAQTDEFGCPWPAPRQEHSMVIVNDAIYIIGGIFISWDVVGEVWRLKLDDDFSTTLQLQEYLGENGAMYFNDDQLLYRQNPNNKNIDRDELCPVKWERLTRNDTSASLLNRSPSDPFPAPRWSHSATVNGNDIWIVGGAYDWATSNYRSDIWVLDTVNLRWKEIVAFAGVDGVNPAGRSHHKAFIVSLDRLRDWFDPPAANVSWSTTNTYTDGAAVGLVLTSSGATDSEFYMLLSNTSCISNGASWCSPARTLDLNGTSIFYWRKIALVTGAGDSNDTAVRVFPSAAAWVLLPDQSVMSIGGLSQTSVLATYANIYQLQTRRATAVPAPYSPAQLTSQAGLTIPVGWSRSVSFLFDRDMYVFGGTATGLWEMWSYQIDTFIWRRIGDWQASGFIAGARSAPISESSMMAHNRTHILAFGGGYSDGFQFDWFTASSSESAQCHSFMYAFDISTGTWSDLTSSLRSRTRWIGSYDDAVATGAKLNNGYVYPTGRCWARGTVIGNHTLVMFGGDTTRSSYYTTPADNALWTLNLRSLEWTLIQAANRTVGVDDPTAGRPSPRKGHSVVGITNDTFAVLFGMDLTLPFAGYSSALWTYNLTSGTWRCLQRDGPTGRIRSAVAVYQSDRIIAYGGQPFTGGVLDTIHSFDLNSPSDGWTRIYPDSTTTAPAARDSATLMSVDPTRELLLFGGLGTSDLVVHVLDMCDSDAGGPITPTTPVHDWLAAIQFAPGRVTFQFMSNGLYPFPKFGVPVYLEASELQFATLAAAIVHHQSIASGISGSTIFIRDTATWNTVRITRSLGLVSIRGNVTIRGAAGATGNSRTMIDCSAWTECRFIINNSIGTTNLAQTNQLTVRLRDFTLDDGNSAEKGGAIYIEDSQVELTRVNLRTSESQTFGGAIASVNSQVKIRECSLSNNKAGLVGGGIYAINSDIDIADTDLTGNKITATRSSTQFLNYGHGGAMCLISCTSRLARVNISSNVARLGGGIVVSSLVSLVPASEANVGLRSSALDITKAQFINNIAVEDGGAIYLHHTPMYDSGFDSQPTDSMPRLHQSRFEGNAAGRYGGAVFSVARQIVSNASYYLSNEAGTAGGAFYVDPSLDASWFLTAVFQLHPPNDATQINRCSNRTSTTATAAGIKQTNIIRTYDAWCNSALYGPYQSSPPASMRLVPQAANASGQFQSAGSMVAPYISLVIVDQFAQRIVGDNSSLISVGPAVHLGGATTVRVADGEATFDQLVFRAPPSTTVTLAFTASVYLPFLERDSASGLLDMKLQSARDPTMAIQLAGNFTFQQVSSCSSRCTYDLPAQSGAQSTFMSLTFYTGLFTHSYDRVTVLMDRGTLGGIQVFATFVGSELARQSRVTQFAKAAPHQHTRAMYMSDADDTNTMTVELAIPSSRITIYLETGDDRVDYISGTWRYSTDCPDGLSLDRKLDQCLYVAESNAILRWFLVGLACVSLVGVLVSFVFLYRYRSFPQLRAGGVWFSVAALSMLGLLPIAGILYALVPSVGSDGICIGRAWLSTLPIIGVVAVLLAKAWRVRTIAQSGPVQTRIPPPAHLWTIIAIVMACQVALCIGFTVMPLSRSVLESSSASGSADKHLFRQCSLEDGFELWFGIQLGFGACICIAAGCLSFQIRSVNRQFQESSHVAVSLFLLVIVCTILIPVAILVQDTPDAILVIQSGGASFVCCMWNIVFFVTKFWNARRAYQMTQKQTAELRKARAQSRLTAADMRSKSGGGHSDRPFDDPLNHPKLTAASRSMPITHTPPFTIAESEDEVAEEQNDDDGYDTHTAASSRHGDSSVAAVGSDHPASHFAHSIGEAQPVHIRAQPTIGELTIGPNTVKQSHADDQRALQALHCLSAQMSEVVIVNHALERRRPAHRHRSFTFNDESNSISGEPIRSSDYIQNDSQHGVGGAIASIGVDDDDAADHADVGLSAAVMIHISPASTASPLAPVNSSSLMVGVTDDSNPSSCHSPPIHSPPSPSPSPSPRHSQSPSSSSSPPVPRMVALPAPTHPIGEFSLPTLTRTTKHATPIHAKQKRQQPTK